MLPLVEAVTGPGPINLTRRGLSLMYGGQTLKGYKSSTLRVQLPGVEIKMRLYLNYHVARGTLGGD